MHMKKPVIQGQGYNQLESKDSDMNDVQSNAIEQKDIDPAMFVSLIHTFFCNNFPNSFIQTVLILSK